MTPKSASRAKVASEAAGGATSVPITEVRALAASKDRGFPVGSPSSLFLTG